MQVKALLVTPLHPSFLSHTAQLLILESRWTSSVHTSPVPMPPVMWDVHRERWHNSYAYSYVSYIITSLSMLNSTSPTAGNCIVSVSSGNTAIQTYLFISNVPIFYGKSLNKGNVLIFDSKKLVKKQMTGFFDLFLTRNWFLFLRCL